MRKLLHFAALILTVAVIQQFNPSQSLAANTEGFFVVWERMEGITPIGNVSSQTINGITPVGFPWSVSRGQAHINLVNGRFRFNVEGLSIGAMPSVFSPIGTTGIVGSVYGTFVCGQFGPSVDTASVKLSPRGDASVQGVLAYEFICDPEDVMFLLRVAEIIPGGPPFPIVGSWLAYGAGRRFQASAAP